MLGELSLKFVVLQQNLIWQRGVAVAPSDQLKISAFDCLREKMVPCVQSLSRGVPEALEIAAARGTAVAEALLLHWRSVAASVPEAFRKSAPEG